MQRVLVCIIMLSPRYKLPVLVCTCVCGCIGVNINVRVKTCPCILALNRTHVNCIYTNLPRCFHKAGLSMLSRWMPLRAHGLQFHVCLNEGLFTRVNMLMRACVLDHTLKYVRNCIRTHLCERRAVQIYKFIYMQSHTHTFVLL